MSPFHAHGILSCVLHSSGVHGRESCRANNTLHQKHNDDRCNCKVVKWLKPSERFYCIYKILCAAYSHPTYFSLLADWADMSTYGRFLSRLSLWENPQHTWDIFQFSSVSMVSYRGVPGGSSIESWIICRDRLAICISCYCCLLVGKSKSTEHILYNGRWPRLCTHPCCVWVWIQCGFLFVSGLQYWRHLLFLTLLVKSEKLLKASCFSCCTIISLHIKNNFVCSSVLLWSFGCNMFSSSDSVKLL